MPNYTEMEMEARSAYESVTLSLIEQTGKLNDTNDKVRASKKELERLQKELPSLKTQEINAARFAQAQVFEEIESLKRSALDLSKSLEQISKENNDGIELSKKFVEDVKKSSELLSSAASVTMEAMEKAKDCMAQVGIIYASALKIKKNSESELEIAKSISKTANESLSSSISAGKKILSDANAEKKRWEASNSYISLKKKELDNQEKKIKSDMSQLISAKSYIESLKK